MKQGQQKRERKEDLEGLTETQYSRWADGSRAKAAARKVDPATADAIRRAFPKEEKR